MRLHADFDARQKRSAAARLSRRNPSERKKETVICISFKKIDTNKGLGYYKNWRQTCEQTVNYKHRNLRTCEFGHLVYDTKWMRSSQLSQILRALKVLRNVNNFLRLFDSAAFTSLPTVLDQDLMSCHRVCLFVSVFIKSNASWQNNESRLN